jgi:hypothetical protein
MKKIIAIAVSLLAPVAVFAQNTITKIDGTGQDSIFGKFTSLGNSFITIVISLAVIWIVVNVFVYLIAGSEDKRKEGGLRILYGVVGLFVILSIWGLVAILKNSFGTGNNTPTENQFPKVIDPTTVR